MTTPTATPAASRLAYLDNLRIYLTILVIFHHASIAFGGGGDWPVDDPNADTLSEVILTWFTAVNQSYFMSAFFLLAGFFTPRSLEKKGPTDFLFDRLIRLGIPLLVYTTLIVNLNAFIVETLWQKQPFSWIWIYNPGHLWFLQALLLFAVGYVVYRWIYDPGRTGKIYQVFTDRFPPNSVLVITIIILAVLSFLVRIFFPVGVWIGGLQLGHFVHYIFCFFAGVLAYRAGWFEKLTRKQAVPWGIVALVGIPMFLVIAIGGGALESDEVVARFLGGLYWQNLVYALWETAMMIAVVIFLLWFFRERVSKAGALAITLAACVYTAYIIHQTVVVTIDIFLIETSLPMLVKFLLAGLIATPLCFLLANWIRKIPGAKRVLG